MYYCCKLYHEDVIESVLVLENIFSMLSSLAKDVLVILTLRNLCLSDATVFSMMFSFSISAATIVALNDDADLTAASLYVSNAYLT